MTPATRIDVKIDFSLTINLTIEPPSTKKYDISYHQGLFQQFKTWNKT